MVHYGFSLDKAGSPLDWTVVGAVVGGSFPTLKVCLLIRMNEPRLSVRVRSRSEAKEGS